ncbi:MAG TPA: discoidin domain-containing protein, partial [Armatimonadetes bacterium]|nr:discoidin domain-containing protein [Armatimonadota bacterium]
MSTPEATLNPPGPNIALRRPYTLSPKPNYPHCTDSGDGSQLTDGKYVKGYFWVQKGCVGWRKAPLVTITIDLGRVEPISGLSFSTAAGVAGVYWPRAILVMVSEDGKNFYFVGDLVGLSARSSPPPREGYATHKFVTDGLKTKGRFVRLVVIPSGAYTFCDEIEIYGGPTELLRQPLRGEKVTDIHAFVDALKTDLEARRRMLQDIEAMERIVKGSPLPKGRKRRLLLLLASLRREVDSMPRIRPEGFKAVLPFNDLHARILAVNAEVLRARGFPPLLAWHKCRWDPLLPWEAPETPP